MEEMTVTCDLQMERETFQVLYVSALCDTADVKPIIYFRPYHYSIPRASSLATKVT